MGGWEKRRPRGGLSPRWVGSPECSRKPFLGCSGGEIRPDGWCLGCWGMGSFAHYSPDESGSFSRRLMIRRVTSSGSGSIPRSQS